MVAGQERDALLSQVGSDVKAEQSRYKAARLWLARVRAALFAAAGLFMLGVIYLLVAIPLSGFRLAG